MTAKDLWDRISNWLRVHKIYRPAGSVPQIDEEGLISPSDSIGQQDDQSSPESPVKDAVVVNALSPVDRQSAMGRPTAESFEKLQDGFKKLIEQLQGINKHLNHQAVRHEELMNRITQLPQLLESIPATAENQKRITEQLIEQLRGAALRNEQFNDSVEKIPAETVKQTDALVNINHQLAAAADIDVQMAESLNSFNQTLDKLNQSVVSQTDGIDQMSKTFAASDRYLKYIISRQNNRFMWIFITAIGVCLAAILILTGIIIFLKR
jgi:hypothetical protein